MILHFNSRMSFMFCANRVILYSVVMLLWGSIASAADPNPASIYSDRGAWPLYRQWNRQESLHFAAWISRIYEMKTRGSVEQRLAKLERVLNDPEMNLLLHEEFAGNPCNPQPTKEMLLVLQRVTDCHKLVMSLAAYYSLRRGLPFMFSTVRAFDGSDIRTAFATYPVATASSFDYPSVHQFFVDATVGTCTGNLRVGPFNKNSELSDTCPVTITREYLIPGCLFYMDGHVLILAKIEPTGNLRFLDATTSPTRDLYTHQGLNAVTGISPKREGDSKDPYADCFRGFRVLRYPMAETDATGKVIKVRRRTDAEMAEFGFSLEQYDKLAELIHTGKIMESGLMLTSMHQFIRYRLREPKSLVIRQLIEDFASAAEDFLKKREMKVQAAWADRRSNGPIIFPGRGSDQNIYNAGGRWGDFSSALDDTEFRAAYFSLVEELDASLSWFDTDLNYLDLSGMNIHAIWTPSDLAWAILWEKKKVFEATTITITLTTGEQKVLSLADIEQRLFDLSFDPNHPPELRWGMVERGSGMPFGNVPMGNTSSEKFSDWDSYRLESYYRTLTEREVGETPFIEAPEQGYSLRQVLHDYLWQKWRGMPSPPLVPHGGKALYEASIRKR